MFDDFKRHYRKVSQVVYEMPDNYSGHLRVHLENNQLVAESSTSDQEKTKRFEILMRHFSSENDSLYYQNIWQKLVAEWVDQIEPETKKIIEERIIFLNQFGFGLSINDEPFTAAKSYQILADGGYFEENPEISAELKALLADLPIIGLIFWFNFHEYNKLAFEIVSTINSVIHDIERSESYRAVNASQTQQLNQCIYCPSKLGTFKSEEHIFPESLGNTELILPRGYVCDTCNNGILSQLDAALLQFDPIAFLQVQFVAHTKDGKLPKANFQNMTIERTEPRHIKITPKDKTGRIRDIKDLGDGWQSSPFECAEGKATVSKLHTHYSKLGLDLLPSAKDMN